MQQQAAQPKPEKTATKEVVVAAKPATAPAAPHKEAEKPQFFTAEHDAAILRMKGEENKSWKEIAAALGFAPGQVKGRFRELAPRVAEEVQAPAIAAWAKGVAKAAPAKVAYHRQPEPSEKPRRFVARPKPDEMFDRDEVSFTFGVAAAFLIDYTHQANISLAQLHLIARIIRKDEKLRWERVSHRFFDKTGRRLHELEFKDRFDPDSDDETV